MEGARSRRREVKDSEQMGGRGGREGRDEKVGRKTSMTLKGSEWRERRRVEGDIYAESEMRERKNLDLSTAGVPWRE